MNEWIYVSWLQPLYSSFHFIFWVDQIQNVTVFPNVYHKNIHDTISNEKKIPKAIKL